MDRKRIILILRIISAGIIALTGYLLFSKMISPIIAIGVLLIPIALYVTSELLTDSFDSEKARRKSRVITGHLIFLGVAAIIAVIFYCIRSLT